MQLNQIKIPSNLVLIKPDKDFEKTKSGLYIGTTDVTAARHFAITGTVLVLPDQLVYRGHEIRQAEKAARQFIADNRPRKMNELAKGNDYHNDDYKSYAMEVKIAKEGSLGYLTEIEVAVNDKVWFDYTCHGNAYAEQKTIEVDGHGECFLIGYEDIFLYERDGVRNPVNGWIWIRKIVGDKNLGNDLVLADTVDTTLKNYAEVVQVGKPILEYQDERQTDYYFQDIKAGDIIYYKGKQATPLEYILHQTEGLENMHKIRRKDIISGNAEMPDMEVPDWKHAK